jgi:hypothetical protein
MSGQRFFTKLLTGQQHYVMIIYVELHLHHSIDMKDTKGTTEVLRRP